jgi:hypothetical protein
LVCYIPRAVKGASIKLLDVNEVAIIMIILGEPNLLFYLNATVMGYYIGLGFWVTRLQMGYCIWAIGSTHLIGSGL